MARGDEWINVWPRGVLRNPPAPTRAALVDDVSARAGAFFPLPMAPPPPGPYPCLSASDVKCEHEYFRVRMCVLARGARGRALAPDDPRRPRGRRAPRRHRVSSRPTPPLARSPRAPPPPFPNPRAEKSSRTPPTRTPGPRPRSPAARSNPLSSPPSSRRTASRAARVRRRVGVRIPAIPDGPGPRAHPPSDPRGRAVGVGVARVFAEDAEAFASAVALATETADGRACVATVTARAATSAGAASRSFDGEAGDAGKGGGARAPGRRASGARRREAIAVMERRRGGRWGSR